MSTLAVPAKPAVPRGKVPPETPQIRRNVQRIFTTSMGLHLLMIVALIGVSGDIHEVSRDSYWYNLSAINKAEQYASGQIQWSKWIDEGWFEFMGLMYWLFGPNMLMVLLVNTLLAGAAGVLLYRLGLRMFESEPVAHAAALTFVWFPSVVYYTSLPLKEAAAVVGVLCVA